MLGSAAVGWVGGWTAAALSELGGARKLERVHGQGVQPRIQGAVCAPCCDLQTLLPFSHFPSSSPLPCSPPIFPSSASSSHLWLQVRRAYKKLALQLHPDKAASACRVAARCCGCGSAAFEAQAAMERLSERATWLFKLLGELPRL